MKLSKKAIEALDRSAKLALALALDFTEVWIERLLAKNKNNGPLTTETAISVISEKTGLSKEEILEESTVEQNTN